MAVNVKMRPDVRDFCSIFVDLLGMDHERKVWVKDDIDISTLGGR